MMLAQPPAPRASGNTCWLRTLPVDQPSTAIAGAIKSTGEEAKPVPLDEQQHPEESNHHPYHVKTRRPKSECNVSERNQCRVDSHERHYQPRCDGLLGVRDASHDIPSMTVPTTAALRHSRAVGNVAPRSPTQQGRSSREEACATLEKGRERRKRKLDG
jgi:hypothetical protein